MALDPKIEEAITKAAEEYGQSNAVVNIICSWFKEIINGNENLDVPEEAYGRLDSIFAEMTFKDLDPASLTLDQLMNE